MPTQHRRWLLRIRLALQLFCCGLISICGQDVLAQTPPLEFQFENNTVASADQINANFEALAAAINQSKLELNFTKKALAMDLDAAGFELDFRNWQLNLLSPVTENLSGKLFIKSDGNADLSGIHWDYTRELVLRFDLGIQNGTHPLCPAGSPWWVPAEAYFAFLTAKAGLLSVTYPFSDAQMLNVDNPNASVFCAGIDGGPADLKFWLRFSGNGQFACLNENQSPLGGYSSTPVKTSAFGKTASLNEELAHFHYVNPDASVFTIPETCVDQPASVWFLDADGDLYGTASTSETAVNQPVGFVSNSDDCDDSDAEKYPGNGC